MLVNIKVTGGLNIESGHIDPKATGGWNIESGQIDPKATQGLRWYLDSLLHITNQRPWWNMPATAYDPRLYSRQCHFILLVNSITFNLHDDVNQTFNQLLQVPQSRTFLFCPWNKEQCHTWWYQDAVCLILMMIIFCLIKCRYGISNCLSHNLI